MMTSPLSAFCLTLLFAGRMAQISERLSPSHHQEETFVSANVGESLTLQCFYNKDSSAIYWYKQSLGQKSRHISSLYSFNENGTFHDEFNNNPRFTLDTGTGKNHLKITNLSPSDSAFYCCMKRMSLNIDLVRLVFVSVKDSGSNVPASVIQSVSQTIQSGDSVTLNCTVHTGSCGGEHSVYWFRDSGESHFGLIYTQGGRNDQCVGKRSTQTQTCEYNLPMKSLNLSHTGTYYCAVVACGHILFGNGSKLDLEGDEDSLVPVYVLSVASAVTTLLCVCLALLVCMMNTTDSRLCGGRLSAPTRTMDDQNLSGNDSVWKNKKSRGRGQTQDTWTECVYFSVKK